jgi:hypothetical protein
MNGTLEPQRFGLNPRVEPNPSQRGVAWLFYATPFEAKPNCSIGATSENKWMRS